MNITAGLDISIEEFETVGNAVKAFASENATVVVGAVIDPNMQDELRVTVVATGIGADRRPDISLVPNSRPEPMPVYVQQGNTMQKAAQQPMRDEAPAVTAKAQPESKANIDIFDIPAFLRKQAD